MFIPNANYTYYIIAGYENQAETDGKKHENTSF